MTIGFKEENIAMKAKTVWSVLLALTLMLSLGAAASADAPAFDLGQAALTKDLAVADGVDTSAFNTFTFRFAAGESETAAAADHPAIADQTVTVGKQADDHAYGSLTLGTVFSIGDFPHAGEYVYTVTEAAGDNDKLSYDDAAYTLRLYVVNGESGLEFSGVTVSQGDEKVDPTIHEGEQTSGFNFENRYEETLTSETGVLTVRKTVTGSYGDKTKTFPVTVTLTLPETGAESDIALAVGSKGSLSGDTVTAELADGESVVFASLPLGTSFAVTETQDALYEGSVAGDLVNETSFSAGTRVEAASTGPILDAAGKTVTLTNSREDVIPTGVVLNSLPYVLLILAAVAGLVYVNLGKRKDY